MSTQNVMANVRALVKKSGLTHGEIGARMGYPPNSARQSISQFLKGENPTIDVLKRFCDAMGVGVEDLL